MATTITWQIEQIDVLTANEQDVNVQVIVHWRCKGEDEVYKGSVYGTTNFIAPKSSFFPTVTLTEQQVLDLCYTGGLNKASIESSVQDQIDTEKTPSIINPPVSWPKTPEKVMQECITGAQKRLDFFAQSREYDGILSACTYATSTVPKFQVEGQYCVEARDQTWAMLYQIMAEVQAGTRPMPSGFADIEPELPTLTWPA